MLKHTPLHPRTSALCASHAWRRWAGYVVASSYELSHEREYHAIRNSAALFDISPLYKYRISGADAARLLDQVMTRDIGRSQIGQVLYTPWCDATGKVMDDGTVARLGETIFRMTSAEPNLRWMVDNAHGLDVVVEDVSETICALALQGPTSRRILQQLAGADLSGLKYYRQIATRLRDIEVMISRTGYTGDLGYEIWMDRSDALRVWDMLVEVGAAFGITPAGMLALDVSRIEAGLMLIDVDYVPARKALTPYQSSTPLELDLAWAVDLRKPNFVGKAALARQTEEGPRWQFVGIEVDVVSLERLYAEAGLALQLSVTAWRTSIPLYVDGSQVGFATSGGWSPLLKRYVALAHVRSAWAKPGTPIQMEFTVEHQRKLAPAHIVAKPFFNPDRKRA